MRLARAFPIFLGAFAAYAALAQAPDLDGPDGAKETSAVTHELDTYALPIAPFGGGTPTLTLSGEVTRRAWRVPAAGQTVASVMQGYRTALSEQGFQAILDCSGEACGGFDFRFEADLLPPPAMAMDVQDFAQLSMKRPDATAHASVLVSRVRDSIFVQIVTVVPPTGEATPSEDVDDRTSEVTADEADETTAERGPDDPPPERPVETEETAGPEETEEEPTPIDGEGIVVPITKPETPETPSAGEDGSAVATDEATPEIAEETAAADPVPATSKTAAAADAPIEPESGASLLENLVSFGHVPLSGLAFESGGAALASGSGAALDRLVALLTDNPDLRIAIVGHSDNRGPLRINIEISQRRAEAVRNALIRRGVDGARLEARGVGYLAPRRSNETEEGRALNRRVELVLREAP